jgi:preprotein translocase subunit Sss1
MKIYVAAVQALINKCDETLLIINKSKHPKKEEYKDVLIFPFILHMGFTPMQTVSQDSNLGQWVMSLV